MKMISFWRDGLQALYIEKEGHDSFDYVRLTEGEVTSLLTYIEQNMPDIWVKATADVCEQAYNDGFDEAYG